MKPTLREGTVILWPDEKVRLEVEAALVQEGYVFDGNGILEFILDNLFEDDEDAEPDLKPGAQLGALLAAQAMQFVNQNPEAVAAAKRKVGEGLNALFSKIKRRTP